MNANTTDEVARSRRDDGPCLCDTSPASDGPEQDCPYHGRPYRDWVERGDQLQDRLDETKRELDELRTRLRDLRDDWHGLPVWGPDSRGLMILDDVDRDGLLAELDAAIDPDNNPRAARVARRASRRQAEAGGSDA